MRKRKIKKLHVLKIIHGYPPYYMAGSEVYTFHLCNELSKFFDITIFTRIEDDFQKPYTIKESNEDGIKLIRVNKPNRDYTFRSKYEDNKMAKMFEKYLVRVKPDIVHIGHLSHLTISIVEIVKKHDIPVIFTLHDYWMMCIRGQLIRDDLSLCSGPEIEKCTECNEKYFTSHSHAQEEISNWLKTLKTINENVDLFISPSKFLQKKYIEYGIPEGKIIYKDYGFNKELFNGIKRNSYTKIRFGFLGRIVPVKGISLIIDAFNQLDHSKAELNIYGKLPSSHMYLKERCLNSAINFRGSYNYKQIGKVLSNIDVLVVPSVWHENSPLVIHEAFLAKIPVITSNLGGMAELVKHEKNGLLFEPGNIEDLRNKMELIINNPKLIKEYSQETYVRSIQEDIKDIMTLYFELLKRKEEKLVVN